MFRAGVQVFEAPPHSVPFEPSAEKAHVLTGTLGLGAQMVPDATTLQFILTDKLAKPPRSATQHIDLEVHQ